MNERSECSCRTGPTALALLQLKGPISLHVYTLGMEIEGAG